MRVFGLTSANWFPRSMRCCLSARKSLMSKALVLVTKRRKSSDAAETDMAVG